MQIRTRHVKYFEEICGCRYMVYQDDGSFSIDKWCSIHAEWTECNDSLCKREHRGDLFTHIRWHKNSNYKVPLFNWIRKLPPTGW